MAETHRKSVTNNESIIDLCAKGINTLPKLEMVNLQLLYIENNKLKKLPEDLFIAAPLLKWLDVRNNLIEKIPLSIKNHANIETILLQNNKISYLPYELGTVKKLQYIQLNGNSIIYPKESIIKLGTPALLKFLRLQYEQENEVNTILDDYKFIDVSMKQYEQKKTQSFNTDELYEPQIKFEEGLKCLNDNLAKFLKSKSLKTNKYLKNNMVKSNEDQVILIQKNVMRDIWLEEKREILNKREKVIQDRKSLAALKNWRNDYKNTKLIDHHTYYALNLSNIPYDMDLNHIKILTREDIEKDLPDKYKKNICKKPNNSKSKSREKMIFHSKIAEVSESMRTVLSENYDWTPRTEKKIIGCKIRKLIDLKDQIVRLKTENDRQT
ncbi:uncharacterized protein LOC143909977 [Arctopsyche grandis]|uniref:uncharacterized protein LOC143909977 n=1 Tax=Arctopsyche grandis TaxID=121162 RepID=UPI00406D8D1E